MDYKINKRNNMKASTVVWVVLAFAVLYIIGGWFIWLAYVMIRIAIALTLIGIMFIVYLIFKTLL